MRNLKILGTYAQGITFSFVLCELTEKVVDCSTHVMNKSPTHDICLPSVYKRSFIMVNLKI